MGELQLPCVQGIGARGSSPVKGLEVKTPNANQDRGLGPEGTTELGMSNEKVRSKMDGELEAEMTVLRLKGHGVYGGRGRCLWKRQI